MLIELGVPFDRHVAKNLAVSFVYQCQNTNVNAVISSLKEGVQKIWVIFWLFCN